MPRTLREFIKIEQHLFNNYKFFMLPEFDQLCYIYLISMAKATHNKIPNDLHSIKAYMRSNREVSDIELTINRLRETFPKLKANKHFMYFEEYAQRYDKRGLINEVYFGEEKEKEKEKEKEGNGTAKHSFCLSVLTAFNKACNKSLTLTSDRKRLLESLFKQQIPLDRINRAIVNFANDDWPERHKFCDLVYCLGVRNKVNNLDKWADHKKGGKVEYTELKSLRDS